MIPSPETGAWRLLESEAKRRRVRRDLIDDRVVPDRADNGRLAFSEETAGRVLAQLQRRSRALHISPQDREDLVQDVAIWIALHREAGRPITEAWLWSTLGQFARSVRRAHRHEMPLDVLRASAEPTRAPRRPSASIEQLTRDLGQREKRVVELLLEGHKWESALQRIGICHGSQSRWRTRIRRGIEKMLGRCRRG
jgi:DNA-directed RNA polymerase specialized sigma24 family protein